MQNSAIYTQDWINGFATAMRCLGADIPVPYSVSSYFNDKDTLLEAIEHTIREDLGIRPEDIYTRSRKQQTVFLRSCAWTLYQEISGATQEQTAEAFGCSHNRSTFVNMRRSAFALIDAYPKYRKQFQVLKSGVMLRYINSNADLQKPYADLGLPSGTLWNTVNAGGLHPAEIARRLGGDGLPTCRQAQELIENCTIGYEHARLAFIVKGPNGNTIAVPADGFTKGGATYAKDICAALLLRPDDGEEHPQDTVSYLFFHHKGKTITEIKTIQGQSLELSVRKTKPRNND